MAQPQYNDTDFLALAVNVKDIEIVTQAAGTFTANLDGGPYTGSGVSETLVRDSLLTNINSGTHIAWTAASEGTTKIRITAVGPGQSIGGNPIGLVPSVVAPAGGVITIVDFVVGPGLSTDFIRSDIEADTLILTLLIDDDRFLTYISMNAAPRVVEIRFTVDPLPVAERTALDALVAAHTPFEIESIFRQASRITAEVPSFSALFAANIGFVTKGPPDGGLQLFNFDAAINASKTYITGLKVAASTTDTSEVVVSPGCATSVSGVDTLNSVSSLIGDLDLSGAGGLDTGSKANSTFYAVYIIKRISDGDLKILFSLVYESTGPLMPSGYTERRYIGDVLTTSTGEITDFRIYEEGRNLEYTWARNRKNPPFNVLTNGASVSFATINLSGTIPVTSVAVRLVINNDNSPSAYLNERDSAGGIDQPFGVILVRGKDSDNPWMGVTSVREIEYCMVASMGSLDVFVVGYRVQR